MVVIVGVVLMFWLKCEKNGIIRLNSVMDGSVSMSVVMLSSGLVS